MAVLAKLNSLVKQWIIDRAINMVRGLLSYCSFIQEILIQFVRDEYSFLFFIFK